MKCKKACLVINPRAGQNLAKLTDVIAVLSAAGWKTDIAIKEYGGHGIGEKLHQEPFIPNYKIPNKGEIIKEGMFICIEPLVQENDDQVIIAPDN